MTPVRRRFPLRRTDYSTVEFTTARHVHVGDRIWHVRGMHAVAEVELTTVKGEVSLVYIRFERTPEMRSLKIPGYAIRHADDEVLREAK